MTHPSRTDLQELFDGDPPISPETARHVTACADCRLMLTELLMLRVALRAAMPPAPAQDMWHDLEPRLPARPSVRPWHGFAAAAAILVLFTAGYIAGQGTRSPSEALQVATLSDVDLALAVQHAGSRYTELLTEVGAREFAPSPTREVAAAVLRGAVTEMATLLPDPAVGRQFVELAATSERLIRQERRIVEF